MAWFIGQSAVMIVLAFLLGLLVGWLIWGRRVRALSIEVIALREAAAACKANHGSGKNEKSDPVRAESAAAASVPADRTAAANPNVNAATDRPATASTMAAGATGTAVGRATVGKAAVGRATVGKPGTSAGGKAAVGKAAVGKAVVDAATVPAANDADRADAESEAADATDAADVTTVNGVPGAAVNGSKHRIAPSGRPDDADDDQGDDDADIDEDAVMMAGSIGVADDATAAAVHIPAPRAEMTDVVEMASNAAAGEGSEAVELEAVEVEAVGETAVESAADELTRIEGIGPKIAAALIAANLRTFAQIADAGEAELTKAVNAAGISFVPSLPTWSQQARLLADGDEEGFLELTERLIAGRVVTAAAAAAAEPEPLAPPDDLARIEGIGPKIAAALVEANIRTYAQLADADTDALSKAIKTAGITFAPSLVTWSQQARLLADGEEDRFAELTARLIAGRRPDDDLERIEGIGPQMAAALHATGIRTYRALADSSDVRLRNAITGSGLSFAPSIVTWARQARLLADGDEDGFTELTRRLIAGRDEGRA